MWVCLNNAFLSIVEDKKDERRLLIRARVEGHIEKVFPGADIFTLEDSDYRYRAYVDRMDVASALHQKVIGIDYPDFKSTVKNQTLHIAYLKFWHIMNELQAKVLSKKSKVGAL